MKKFLSLMNKKWVVSQRDLTEIIGYWAEDENEYIIKAPIQLASAIVALQNYVVDLYVEIKNRESCIARLEKELDEIKKSRGYID